MGVHNQTPARTSRGLAIIHIHIGCIICTLLQRTCHGYSFSSRRPLSTPRSLFGFGFGFGGDGDDPPPFQFYRGGNSDDDDSEFDVRGLLLLLHSSDSDDTLDEIESYDACNATLDDGSINNSAVVISLRGGGAVKKRTEQIFSSVTKLLPFFNDGDTSQSESKLHEELLASTNVTAVTAPSSELLPPEVITQSAEHAKLIGGTLTPASLDLTAKSINDWYASQGYVMNSVTGATLVPSKNDEGQGRVELKVREAKLSKAKDKSVVIRFVEQCGDESETDDDTITIPVQNDVQRESSNEPQHYQKYRITDGRTRPLKLARMVGMSPGSNFRILPQRWSRIVASPGGIFGSQTSNASFGKSTIFSTIHAVRPIPEDDGTVSVEIIATENKPFVSLEYGVTKSLYSDQWEGEFDMKHANAFGGGEIATLNVKKGRGTSIQEDDDSGVGLRKRMTDGPMSWRTSITDDSLGGGDVGYDLELFRDHVGSTITTESDAGSCSIGRTGATMQLRLPRTVLPRAVSASFEQIDSTTSSAAPMQSASISMNVGPIKFLRSGVSALLTAGIRRDRDSAATKNAQPENEDSVTKPYFRGTVTAQKIVPLCQSPFTSGNNPKSCVDLAMRHVASISTKHLPRHEAILLGVSSRVRGYNYYHSPQTINRRNWSSFLKLNNAERLRPPAAVANSISGNIEVRLPFKPFSSNDFVDKNLKTLSSTLEGTLIAFGDWAFSQGMECDPEERGADGRLVRHSSVGVGYRKVAQGIPLKLDAVITEHGTGGLFFGIGRDFGA